MSEIFIDAEFTEASTYEDGDVLSKLPLVLRNANCCVYLTPKESDKLHVDLEERTLALQAHKSVVSFLSCPLFDMSFTNSSSVSTVSLPT